MLCITVARKGASCVGAQIVVLVARGYGASFLMSWGGEWGNVAMICGDFSLWGLFCFVVLEINWILLVKYYF